MRKFLVGVGIASLYDPATGDLIGTSKTMLDDSIATTTSSSPINGGQGNALLYTYFHTAKMAVTLTETQFNLAWIGKAVGSNINTGKNIWVEESVVLGVAGVGVVLNTPLLSPDSKTTIFGWVTDSTETTTKVAFTGSTFTLPSGIAGQIVTVRYYKNDASAKSITISSNIVPSIVRVVIDAQEGSNDSGTGICGSIQCEIDRVQLDGSNSITLKSNGVSDTQLKGDALAFIDPVTQISRYATITEILTNANWYDTVYAMASTVDPITLTTTTPYVLDLRAIPTVGNAFKPVMEDLTFVSSTPTTATIDATGTLTKIATGTTVITVSITAKPSITTTINVTVS